MKPAAWKLSAALALGLGLGWATAWLGGSNDPQVLAQTAQVGGHLQAFTTQSGEGVQYLFLVDSQKRVLNIYEFDARKVKLKLAAVRHFAADQQLSEFNNEPPYVADIEALLKR